MFFNFPLSFHVDHLFLISKMLILMPFALLSIFRLQHHRMCQEGAHALSRGECSPDGSREQADGETLLSVTDSDSDLDV